MKMTKFKKTSGVLLSCLGFVAAAFFGLLFSISPVSVKTNADTLASNVYKTDGASVRVFDKRTNGELKETDKQGIRFHVEMGAGYVYGGQPILNTAETYERGSYKITEGFKTYTLVLPTRLLSGELTVDTDKVMKIDTTEYWFKDKDGNWESVAYIHSIPEKWYTDNLSFRGVICTVEGETETVVAQTEVAKRALTWVAKQAYNDTIKTDNYWGSAENDNTAAPLIKKFIPTYSITYNVNGVETEEEVLWGDAPQNVPSHEGDTWYDTNNNEEVDVTKTMDWTVNRTLELHTTSSEEFILTGVATKTGFEVDSNTYHGVKVFATLHREAFANKTQMDVHAVNVAHMRGEEVLNDGFALQGVWTLEEQNSLGEWQMLLFFALDDTTTLQNGDKIVIKGDSVFYANNVMYKLTEDYTIDYTKTNEVEDYGMYLGDLYNSDVKGITNCSEDNTGNEGEPNEFTLRVEFYEDVMINGEFTFEFGPDSDTSKYPYPVYIKCGEDENKLIPIAGGRYYWNEGDYKILELIGAGEYANRVFGWHNGDELIGAPGTIVKQNGGYYIFKDEMYSYFLANGNVDKWGYALGDWVVGDELAEYTTSEFAAEGSVAETTDYGTLADEIRINTTNHWFGQSKVSLLTTEKMSDSAPYAIYCTSEDGTVTEIGKVRYHGQANDKGGNYQILGLCGEGKFTVGDVVTIAAGTRFWLGTEYYTVTEGITYYYNGNFWVQNYDESTMGELSSASFGDRAHNQGATETRMYFTAPLAGYTTTDGGEFDELRIGTGSITFNGKSLSYVRYQRWDANSTWLSFGGYSGSVTFGDKVVIEEGTTIWGANKVAYKFTEKVEWIYAANPADANRTWSRVLGGVTVSATADNATVSGAGTFAVGETYTLNVAPNDGYLISAVIVNNVELPLNASNTYTFTVALHNTIEIKTIVGHKVTFVVLDGATVDGGAITNGRFKAVEHGDSLTFSVAAGEGYKINVAGATDNGNGTYTVSNVTADKTVTVSVVKLYKVTYSGENANVTANVANGAWVDNGTTVTFTIAADNGYTLVSVSNATKVNATTCTATVNGADLSVTATALKNGTFIDGTDMLTLEDRTSWASDSEDVVTLGLMSNGAYFKSFAGGCWYQGNTAVIDANNGVDILQYIYINGECARDLLIANQANQQNTEGTGSWLSNPAAWPIAVETNGDVWIRLDTTKFTKTFTFTIKAGFRIIDENGAVVAVTNDINIKYDNGSISKEIDMGDLEMVDVSFNLDSGVLVNGGAITNGAVKSVIKGQPFNFTVAASEGYKITGVTGATDNHDGTYTVVPMDDATVSISSEKLYKVTYSGEENVTINGNVADGAWVEDGTVVEFTVTANSGYTVIEVKGVEKLNPNTYTATVNGENLNIEIIAFENSTFVDITDRLQIEDRAWGITEEKHPGGTNEIYVAMLDMGITQADGTHYFNTSVNDTWYVGNNTIIANNGGVDIMEYIYVNGVSARELITTNANGVRNSNACACWLSNPAAYPVYVETTNGSGLMMRFAKAVFGAELTITIKAGFRITDANGDLVAVTKDIDFLYNGEAESNKITKQDHWKTVALETMKANISTYTSKALKYTVDADTFNSVQNCASVTFNAELFEMLQYYGYSTLNFDLTVRANRTTTVAFDWQIMKGNEQIFYVDNNKNYDKKVSTSTSEQVTYEVYYRSSSLFEWQLDEKSIWTIANIDIS